MNNKTLIYLLITFLAVFVVSGAFMFFSNKKTERTISNELISQAVSEEITQPKTEPTEGFMKLTLDKGSYMKGEKVFINLEADSGDKSVVGYDVILSYDPLAFEFVSATSSLSDYKLYSYKKENYLTLTAVKNLSSALSPLKSRIATLVLSPIKSGEYSFSLESSINSEKTHMVTDDTEVLSPELNGVMIKIN